MNGRDILASVLAVVLRFQELPEEMESDLSVLSTWRFERRPDLQKLIVVGLQDVHFYNYLQICMSRAGRTDRRPNARIRGLDLNNQIIPYLPWLLLNKIE